jgi:hypothetical protein
MATKCKTCANGGVYGFDNAPYIETISAIIGAVVTGKVDEMIVMETDGTAKDNYLANNPTIKDAAGVAAGVALTALVPGEMAMGGGIGIATYFGYNLVTKLMNKEPSVTGLTTYRRPGNIASIHNRTSPNNLGLNPANITSTYSPSNNERAILLARMRANRQENQRSANRVKIPEPQAQVPEMEFAGLEWAL